MLYDLQKVSIAFDFSPKIDIYILILFETN